MLVLKDTKGVEIMIRQFDFEKIPVVEIVNDIMVDAAKRGASDIKGSLFYSLVSDAETEAGRGEAAEGLLN